MVLLNSTQVELSCSKSTGYYEHTQYHLQACLENTAAKTPVPSSVDNLGVQNNLAIPILPAKENLNETTS